MLLLAALENCNRRANLKWQKYTLGDEVMSWFLQELVNIFRTVKGLLKIVLQKHLL